MNTRQPNPPENNPIINILFKVVFIFFAPFLLLFIIGYISVVKIHTKDFIIEPGPPFRAVFVYNSGLIDNWQGIIYDPSGLLEKVINYEGNHWWDDESLKSAKRLFGGDIYHCEKLDIHWYFCSFT